MMTLQLLPVNPATAMLAWAEAAPEVLDGEIGLQFGIGFQIFEAGGGNAVEQVGYQHCWYALGLVGGIDRYQEHVYGVGLAEDQGAEHVPPAEWKISASGFLEGPAQ